MMEHQLQELESIIYLATDLVDFSNFEIRICEYRIMYATATN